MNIKVNDNVLVITGKYKGNRGKVLKTIPGDNKVIVEGVNIVHKHEKARKANETSRIITEEAPIDASNVMVICPGCNKPTRVYRKIDEQTKKYYRYHGGVNGCQASLDKAFVKAAKKAAEAAAAKEEAPKKRTRKRSQKAEAAAADETQE